MKAAIISIMMALVAVIPSGAQEFVHPWQGKTVAYLGDSITDPNNKAASEKYWALLSEWLGIKTYVYAKSGRQWDDVPRQATQLSREHGDDFDAIVIMMGTNDFNNSVALGEWYSEEATTVDYAHRYEKRPELRLRRTPRLDAKTYRGRINIAMDSLRRMFPQKQIVILTPLHRAGFYANEKNWQPGEEYANRLGLYLDAYVGATREAADVWAVPVIDLGALCGLYPESEEHGCYFNDPATDRLHPNNNGHMRMAKTLYYQLLTLPCRF